MNCAIIADYRELAKKYEDENDPKILKLKDELDLYIRKLFSVGYDNFYVNCEYGIPLWAAEIICEMKKYKSIKLHIIIPYEEQAAEWSEDKRERYFAVHEQCDSLKMVDTRYDEECYIKAEEIMVNKSDRILFCQRCDDEYFPHYLDEYDVARTFLYF